MRTGLVTCLALLALAGCKAKQSAASPYTTTPAAVGRIVGQVTATGTLSALVTVQVGSQVSGRVAELHADFNSQVHKGQVLAKIDPQLFQAAIEQARANATAANGNLAKARAQATQSQRQLAREKELFARKLVAQADLDTAQAAADSDAAQVQVAQGQVAQAKASLHQAEVNLAYTTITSPIDGTVISRAVDVGQTVAASLQAPVLFTIAQDLQKMQVDTSVAEADVGKLKAAMPATFTVDAYPGKKFRGAIRQIRNAPTTVQNVVTYDAVIDVANPNLELRPGMTANVTFVYARSNHALEVPNAALRFRPASARGGAHHRGARGASAKAHSAPADGGVAPTHEHDREKSESDKTVYVLRGGQPVAVPITVGITDGSHTEVLSGALHEGDLVIVDANTAPGGDSAAKRRFGRVF